MRIIGILGGMSWASTALYYQRLNTGVAERLGGLHSAEILLRSVDFARIEAMQREGRWAEAGATLAREARLLEGAGAELVLLATNTMHRIAGSIEAALGVPFLHIADATADAILARGLRRPGLIATRYTMEEPFYTGRLAQRGLAPLVPDGKARAAVNRVIFEELCRGQTRMDSRTLFEGVARDLLRRGADCIILGCTEVGMLLNARNVPAPVFDTTHVHCDRALELALEDHRP